MWNPHYYTLILASILILFVIIVTTGPAELADKQH